MTFSIHFELGIWYTSDFLQHKHHHRQHVHSVIRTWTYLENLTASLKHMRWFLPFNLGDQVGSPGADPLIKNSALVTSVDWFRKARPVGSGRT